MKHELFVNHSEFFPDLRPSVYSALVERFSNCARESGVHVHDGRKHRKDIKLRDHMHFAVESTESVVSMYSAAIIDMIDRGQAAASRPEIAIADALVQNSLALLTKADDSSDEEFLAAHQNRVRGQTQDTAGTQEDRDVIRRFLAAVRSIQEQKNRPVREPTSINRHRRLPHRMPAALPSGDTRFAVRAKRVFVCDGCGNIVPYSQKSKQTVYHRIQCDFAGSYVDNTWTDIPGCLQKQAWEDRLIDATWHCHQFCKAPMTGIRSEERRKRTQASQIHIHPSFPMFVRIAGRVALYPRDVRSCATVVRTTHERPFYNCGI